jgi:hypothetical protein
MPYTVTSLSETRKNNEEEKTFNKSRKILLSVKINYIIMENIT